jgi:hypothetical protein
MRDTWGSPMNVTTRTEKIASTEPVLDEPSPEDTLDVLRLGAFASSKHR